MAAASGTWAGPPMSQGDQADTLRRLRTELEDMRRARDQAQGTQNAMAVDLLNAHEDIEAKEEDLKKMSQEVASWRQKADQLSTSAPDGTRSSTSTNKAESAKLIQARQQIQHLTAALAKSDAMLSAKIPAAAKPRAQQPSLEAKRHFEAQRAQIQEHWRNQVTEQKTLRQTAEDDLQNAKTHFNTQIEDHQRRLQEVETMLQESPHRVKIGSGRGHEQLDRPSRLVSELEGRIEDQRLCTEHFKRMSERLTTQVRQLGTEKQCLEHELRKMMQHTEGQRSSRGAFKQQHVGKTY